MSKLTRWEPFRELVSMRKEMNRLFDEVFTRPLAISEGWGLPLIDLYQTDNEIVVKATLPGVEADDLDIQVIGDTLTIQAEVKQEEEIEESTYHLREQRYQSFSRSLTLPAPVKASKAAAEMKNGVLTLTLPKAEEVKPEIITVKAK